MSNEEKEYWILWNQFYAQIGPIRFEQLLKAFGSAEKAWKAPAEQFSRIGWGPKELELLKERDNLMVGPILGAIIKYGANVITLEEETYPKNLIQIPAPPPLIYVRGELLPQDNLSLAVVGSRRATNYGKEVVRALIPDLAASGLTIISGLALGIDAEAHRAALSVGGRTIAVLACGIDQIYPPSNVSIAQEMLESGKGAIITEFPPETPTYPANFPIRNRIISGISLGTLVIEAAEGSGTFHTVASALDQGREVFAVPGSIFSPYSAGTAKLIERGAKPVTRAEDILEELQLEDQLQVRQARETLPPDPEEEKILVILGSNELHVDEIFRQSDLDTAKVSSLLTLMEMKGLVRNLGGGIYQATAYN
ncbi:DNA protecting protein DprA [candidate division WWE3 bacterium RBG_19FT_COMBO_53_11]|uniref:DNA protecting protein DprA n=1 Tax=candidate division WWE3 bacterium RBG_19FT_COMBO_53_11 TaxID=1802613 RepID=A0A1F4UKE3_UNCKA|nr:MAG: DNA protecting protein DprA [candidate division WWE3 bacterium RBG_16_52_45]OGC44683.1 MAG: DNA protecting protein DprA [candidate division WWE3 bacterium RBG_19FT_COMBO_53_11]